MKTVVRLAQVMLAAPSLATAGEGRLLARGPGSATLGCIHNEDQAVVARDAGLARGFAQVDSRAGPADVR